MEDRSYPRTLVVSNNSFSKTSSNGRTLRNLFIGWPKERIAQFCVSTTEPDYSTCENYYLLSDNSVFDGFKHLKKGTRCNIDVCKGTEGNTVIGKKRVIKTPWKALARHIVWRGHRWESTDFKDWVSDFNPEVIVVMNSDATFILDIAAWLSKKRRIPLVMFNTEGFYFFKKNYFNRSRCFSQFAFNIYQHIYRTHFINMMKQVVYSVHLNSMLKQDYCEEFGGEHSVLYTSSSLRFDSSNMHLNSPTFVYLGNFGFDRPMALIEIAEVLQSINSNYKLAVYGCIPNHEIKELFDSCPGIEYKGFISYDEVIKVMYSSTILFHAESQLPEYGESLRYGFSTKIADSISCGHPFVLYSSSNLAGAKYIIETGAGWHSQNKKELLDDIVAILTKEKERGNVLLRAREVAIKNHCAETNAERMREILSSVVSKYEYSSKSLA